jgi:hypothetical protein
LKLEKKKDNPFCRYSAEIIVADYIWHMTDLIRLSECHPKKIIYDLWSTNNHINDICFQVTYDLLISHFD